MDKGYRYIYGQIFKYRDWFENLWNGLLDFGVTISTVKLLKDCNDIGMIGAKNLIVADQVHKKEFVKEWCKKLGLTISNDYRYVAGTCFAARAKLLIPLQNMKFGIDDFNTTRRGDFSLAHALERIMCGIVENQGFKIFGNEVRHKTYPNELRRERENSSLILLENCDFKIDYDFFYKSLESRQLRSFEIKYVRVGDIKRKWIDGMIYSLDQCSPYKYLNGDIGSYENYCNINEEKTGFRNSKDRFDNLIKSMKVKFDEKFIPVLNDQLIVMDGQHRLCFLLNKYGHDYMAKCLVLSFLKRD